MNTYLELGSYNVICDRCGRQYKNHQLEKEWTGLMVCTKCYEVRHPQTLVREPRAESTITWSRPEAEDTFMTTDEVLTTELFEQLLTENELPIYTEG